MIVNWHCRYVQLAISSTKPGACIAQCWIACSCQIPSVFSADTTSSACRIATVRAPSERPRVAS